MSKYATLFHSQSGGSDAASHAASASPPAAETSSPSVSDTIDDREVSTSGSPSAGPSAASPTASVSSPHRNRLVRRRRDGAKGSDALSSGDASSTNSREPSVRNEGEQRSVGLNTQEDSAARLQQQTAEAQKNGARDGASLPERGEVSPARPGTLAPADSFDDADGDEGDVNARAPGAAAFSSGASASNTPIPLYTCDACMHFVASTYHDLEQHALQHHADALADYSRLRTVAEKLVPVWPQVRQRKAAAIQRWGEEVFRVAVQRDAGAAKMAEAHRARAQLELVVQRWHPNGRVFIFGSSVAFGVWDGMSDIDFTVVDVEDLEAGVWPPSEKNAVRTITELLRRAGFSFVNLEPISHARVPIIKHHASLPIRLTDEQRHRLREEAQQAARACITDASATTVTPSSTEEATQLEAELVIARSVRYTLNLPASALDSAVFEASIRVAVGSAAVQQVWWNRSREMCCMTFDTTTNAIKAATCPLHFVSAGMRARVQPLHEECRPELYGMDFDLSFRAFGIRNSHLLRRYLLSHPCARPGALVLKDWSKSSGVNNSMNGYLTSYAINIMWIYYLVHHHIIPYVSPTNDIPASLRGNVSGDPEYAAMVDPAWTAEEREAMQAQAGELLLGFFYYYAFDFDWETNVVSLNRPGVTTKASLGWDVEDAAMPAGLHGGSSLGAGAENTGSPLFSSGQQQQQQQQQQQSSQQAQDLGFSNSSIGGGVAAAARRNRATTRYSFCIEDPYEENLNLGRHMGVTKTMRVQTELYRGLLSLLKDDVQHCCVFAGTAASAEDKTKREGKGGKVNGGTSEASAAEPTELPLRVLYKLMAIATRELALARAAHHNGVASASSSAGEFPGLPLQQLTSAFKARAPGEWKVACNVWNVQQLLYRLGLKLHRGTHVMPRREVGVRRLASQVPQGVVFATASEPGVAPRAGDVHDSATASGASAAAAVPESSGGVETPAALPTSAEQVDEMNAQLLSTLRQRHLSTDIVLAVARGYECLTPQWVAWSKPWAALSAWWTDRRQQQQQLEVHTGNIRNASVGSGGVGGVSSPRAPEEESRRGSPASPPRVSAVAEQAVGVMHQTRPNLFPVVVGQQSLMRQRRSDVDAAAQIFSDARRRISIAAGRVPAGVPAISPSPLLRRAWHSLFRC